MSRHALIKQRDVTRVVKGYAAAGVVVEMKVENGVARFIPVDEGKAAAAPSDDDREAAYERWKQANGG